MMMRLMPPMCTMLRPAKSSSTFWVPPSRASIRPTTRAKMEARVTRAFLPLVYAVEGSRSIRLLLGKATAAARIAMRAGNMNARKLPSIAIASL